MPDSSRIKAAAEETIITQTLCRNQAALILVTYFGGKKMTMITFQYTHRKQQIGSLNGAASTLLLPGPLLDLVQKPVKRISKTCNNPHFHSSLKGHRWPRRPVDLCGGAATTGEKSKAPAPPPPVLLRGQAKSWYIRYCLSCQWLYLNIAYITQPLLEG